MSDRDFVVKNGLQINGGTTWTVNSTAIGYQGSPVVNSSFFHGQANTVNTSFIATISANNASFLGGVAAASYVNTSGNYTLSGNISFSGNLTFTGTNNQFGTIRMGANVLANSTGFYVNGQNLSTGGYYKGNDGAIGSTNGRNNLYRVNSNTQSNNITIEAGENALTVGPLVIQSGFNLTVQTGGRAVII